MRSIFITCSAIVSLLIPVKINAQTVGQIPKYQTSTTFIDSRIKDNGTTVGIGGGTIPSTNPPALYTYGGGAYFDIPNISTYQGDGKARLAFNRTNATSYEALFTFNTNGTYKWAMGLDNDGTENFHLFSSTASVLSINTNGSFGIGLTSTATPLAKLHVAGDILATPAVISTVVAPMIHSNTAFSTASAPDFTWNGGAGNTNTGIFHPSSGVGGFFSNGNESMRIDNDKVIIGGAGVSNIPGTYKLYVSGGILTEQVRVAVYNSANWADYVFGQEYKLMSLPALEQYVRTNKHLPNVPSANEVVKDGVDVAQMSSKLLEKIEELTLYVIEQDKKINELEKQLKGK